MMEAMKFIVAILLLSSLVVECTADESSENGVVNKIVNTALDLTSHLAKFTVSVTLENKGDQSVAHVLYLVDPMLVDNLAFISAEVSVHAGSHYVTCTIYSRKEVS